MERDIESAIDLVKNTPHGCALLIGAGVSVKAGIPLASGFVDRIRDRYPAAHRRAAEKSYSHCMAQLTPGARHEMVSEAVSQARVNWAHVALAQLIKIGKITRVLTTNFDPLVMRACALVGVYPAIYDFAASSDFRPAFVSDPAIFHLHGQHSGFVQLHTASEVAKHFDRLRPVFADAGTGRPWIVVGYSGDNDPVFEHLAAVPRFDHGLHWIGFRDADPPKHVSDRLLGDDKYAYYVRGYDADGFFVRLAQALDCFPPAFIAKPFSHLKNSLAQLTPFEVGKGSELNIVDMASARLDEAIQKLEVEKREQQGVERLLAGDTAGVQTLAEQGGKPDAAMLTLQAWALVAEGDVLTDAASTKRGPEATELFKKAYDKYARALEVGPKRGAEAKKLGALVREKVMRGGRQTLPPNSPKREGGGPGL